MPWRELRVPVDRSTGFSNFRHTVFTLVLNGVKWSGRFSRRPMKGFDSNPYASYTDDMDVHLSPDKQARLQQIGTRVGKNAEQMVEEAVDRMLEYEEHFVAAVEAGRASARRGDLLDHDDVAERIERILHS